MGSSIFISILWRMYIPHNSPCVVSTFYLLSLFHNAPRVVQLNRKNLKSSCLWRSFPIRVKKSKSAIAGSVPPPSLINIEYQCSINVKIEEPCGLNAWLIKEHSSWARHLVHLRHHVGELGLGGDGALYPHDHHASHRQHTVNIITYYHWHLPNSWVVIFPSPLISNSENASLNSSIWSSDMSIPSISIILHQNI